MNESTVKLYNAITLLDDGLIEEAMRCAPEDTCGSSGSILHTKGRNPYMKKKRIITIAIAAALLIALSVGAYAAYASISTPQAAEKVAREQIQVWKDMGILSQDVEFEGEADEIYEVQEQEGGEYWYDRLFPHSYDVRWFVTRDGAKYGCNLGIDTLSGKILYASIDANPDADDEPIPGMEAVVAVPVSPDELDTTQTLTYCFYDNFDDIFSPEMTVDEFCSLLAEYWGFTGHTLAETVDQFYFDEPVGPVDGSSLLKDMPADTADNYYLTVFFEGDQEGTPMYIQLHQFMGYVSLSVGTRHSVG